MEANVSKTRVLWLAVLLASYLTREASADGMFVWRGEARDIHEPEQKALLIYDDGLEDLVLEVRFDGAPVTFGWLIPLPSPPRMRTDDPHLFVELSMRTKSAYAPRSERTLRVTMGTSAPSPEVNVLQQATIGI